MKITKVKNRDLYCASVRKPDGNYKKVYGKTKKEVREKADSLTFNISIGNFVEDNKITFGDWLDEWSKGYLIDVSESTKVAYKGLINNHIKPALGKSKIQSLTHNKIQQYINSLIKKLSPKTIRNVHLVIHRSLRDAKLNGYISDNPADNIILPKLKRKEMEVLDQEEVIEFLNLAYEQIPEYADCFEFLILTGLRVSEFVGLTLDSYNPETRELKINKQYSSKFKKFISPKHDVFRTIIISERAHQIIVNRINKAKKISSLDPEINPDNFIFLNPDYRRYSDATMYRKLKTIAVQIQKPNLRVHDLRHTHATLSLASGADIKTISQNLGHSSPSFTMNKYAHSTKAMQVFAAEKLDSLFEN